MKEKLQKFREYIDYIERHYDNIQKAWKLIQDKCKGKSFKFLYDDFLWHTINADVINHDESKLSEHEFTQYRSYFFPTVEETKNKGEFKKAWNHHKENNLHHWQTWTTKHADSIHAEALLVMNVIDWVAMGFEFNDTAKEYYEKNKESIILPDWSIKLMYEIFDLIY